ncbi:TRAP transporter small permease [Thalassobaculum sp.]|uniref:TRAP transporter small permease subunit n=1 Tax=Thalassobaculum sp. TaxID=2022740 RepID=UPI0032EB6A71
MLQGESRFGLEALTRRVSKVLAWVAGGAILFGCAVPITIDVVSRFFLNRTLLESFEISGYALAACIGLGMGYTVSTKANVRVDFLTMRLPPGIRVVFDLVAAAALAVVAAAIAYFAWGVLQQSEAMNARSMSILQVPLVIPQSVWWVGLFWFACVAVLTPVLAVLRLLGRDRAGADRLIGSTDLAEELELIGADGRAEKPR